MHHHRLIKFRIWDSKRKEWVHGPGHEINLFGEIILMGEISRRPDDTSASLEEFVHDFIALQFTGHLDKNGKEIYEGDILRSSSKRTGKVFWELGAFQWLGDPLCYDFEDGCSITETTDWAEVMGNEFENPDLLK